MRFEYWKSGDGRWQWELKTSIGDVLAYGSPCPSRELCIAATRLVKLAASAALLEVSARESTSPFTPHIGAPLGAQPV